MNGFAILRVFIRLFPTYACLTTMLMKTIKLMSCDSWGGAVFFLLLIVIRELQSEFDRQVEGR